MGVSRGRGQRFHHIPRETAKPSVYFWRFLEVRQKEGEDLKRAAVIGSHRPWSDKSRRLICDLEEGLVMLAVDIGVSHGLRAGSGRVQAAMFIQYYGRE